MAGLPTTPAEERQQSDEREEREEHGNGLPDIDAHLMIQGADAADIQTLIVDGQEALGRLFSYTIHVAATKALREEKVVGSKATLLIGVDGVVRTLHGMISECAYDGAGHEDFYYILTFSPEFWRLTQRVNCRIFHDLPTPEIAERVFRDHGLIPPAFKPVLREKYGPRNYCVQYGESDWDFVSRLFEEEGIYHFFREDEAKDRTVLAITDGPHGHLDCPYGLNARYHATDGLDHEPASIHEFRFRRVIRAGRVSQTDYAASKPSLPLATSAVASESDAEVFVFPGEYRDKELGQRLSQVRLDELRTGAERGIGRSTRADFAPGYRFKLNNHPIEAHNRAFLITALRTRLRTPVAAERAYAPSDAGPRERTLRPAYENEFTVIPSEQTFRPERSTQRPRIRGPQTATVVGPQQGPDGNGEIYTDKLGRVKVQFRWDREGRSDERSSCWVRVSQAWAGGGFGAIMIPRVGQEVIVDFLEGDPDQPIIVGRVYNGESLPPLDLPKDKNCTVLKSNSTPGGGGYNGIRFDDTKGTEKFSIHAQYDMDTKVLHDSSVTIDHDSSLTVKNDRKIDVDGTHTETIKGDVTFTAESTLTRTAAKDVTDTHKENQTVRVTKEYGLEAKVVKIMGKQEITLSVGSNYIKIDKSGITIWGTLVKVN